MIKEKLDLIRFSAMLTLMLGLYVSNHWHTTFTGIFGYSLFALGVAGVIWAVWKERQLFPEEEEEEEYDPTFLTVGQLINRLEEFEDDTCVVVDSNGQPITSITVMSDEDFGSGVWLRGFEGGRDRYRIQHPKTTETV